MKETGYVRSVERAADILYCLADGIHSITEIGKALKLNKSTVYRLLITLEKKGLVSRTENNLFEIGSGFVKMAATKLLSVEGLVAAARPSMFQLRNVTRETVTLHVLKGLERICVAEVESPHPLRFTAGVGECVPLYAGAASFILLSFLDNDTQEIVFSKLNITPLTSKTIISPEDIMDRMQEVRKKGCAISFGERLQGTACISVPIFNYIGIIAALSILGPMERLDNKLLMSYLSSFQAEARKISKKLGCDNYDEKIRSYQ